MDNQKQHDVNELHEESTKTHDASSNSTRIPSKTSSFGTRTIFGGGKVALWGTFIAIGCALAAIAVACVCLFGPKSDSKTQMVTITVLDLLITFIGTLFAWIVLVDKRTMKEFEEHSEESVENSWLQESMTFGFIAMLVVNVIFLFALEFIATKPISVDTCQNLINADICIGLVAWLGGYAILRWRGIR
ncbi:hypothetical protein OZX62_04690 [Bifidobacterium sp. ESL0690]|uniref:hypothetical protein n=1 Tax=Bifidobacterium sp. ESL0690 TaxID=2983214 RepID=UPI0023F7281E|nr:hypothetical protein [Bifidobacterium sp. ESL0690]WEV47568.1 hypothetical protein OZX62_04690 [Bifidobacterium sp. ESL0690]